MTISGTNRTIAYVGNGLAATFAFSFVIFQPSDLLVVAVDLDGNQTTKLLNSDYSVLLNSNQDTYPGGSITLLAGALKVGYGLTITSDVPAKQGTDLPNGGGFYPEVITTALDRLTVLVQQLQVQVNRAIKIPLGDPTSISTDLPLAMNRAGCLLMFASDGSPSIYTVPTSAVPGSMITLACTPAVTFNAALASSFTLTLTGNVTSSTLAGATAGQTITFKFKQDGTGGRTFVWPTNVKNASAPNLAAGKTSTQAFFFDGTVCTPIGAMTIY